MTESLKKIIVVIGMHRTGTSLVTRGLQALGVSLGEDLLPAMAEVNAKGFWEDAEINALNIEMLQVIGMEWDAIMPMTHVDVEILVKQGFLLRAVALLRNRVQRFGLFGLKDPRIAKLMPFWDRVLLDAGFEPCYLMTIRNPLSVVKSLEKRDGFEPEKSYYVWLTNVLSALSVAVKRSCLLVDYDLFISDPVAEINRIGNAFGLSVIAHEQDIFLQEFLDQNLRHAHFHLADLTLDASCPELVISVYKTLYEIAKAHSNLNVIDAYLPVWLNGFNVSETTYRLIDKLYIEKHQSKKTINELEVQTNLQRGLIEKLELFTKERERQVESLYKEIESLESVRAQQVIELNKSIAEIEESRKVQVASLSRTLDELNVLREQQITEAQQALTVAEQVRERQVHELERTVSALNALREQQLAEAQQALTVAEQVRERQVHELERTVSALNALREQQLAEAQQALTVAEQVREGQVHELERAMSALNALREQQLAEAQQALTVAEQVREAQVHELGLALSELNSVREQQREKLEANILLLQQQLDVAQESLMNHAAALEALREREVELHNYIASAKKQFDEELTKRDQHGLLINDQLQVAQASVMQQMAMIEALRANNQYLTSYIEMILQSRSWKITRPIRVIARLLSQGLGESDKRELLSRLRSINHKLPYSLQKIMRLAARKVFPSLQFSQLSQESVLVTRDTQITEPSLALVDVHTSVSLAPPSEHDIFVWGVIDWHFRHQRPQQIAQALAQEGDRVFYISSNLIQANTPGYAIEALDDSQRLFQVNLCVKTPVPIYHHAPSEEVLNDLRASLGAFLAWTGSPFSVSIIQHPFWRLLAESVPNSRLVYDCMDHHEGFDNTGSEIIDLERALFRAADLTIVTSGWLDDAIAKYTDRRVLIRNAGEYEYFSAQPSSVFKDSQGRKIIGYYGAIAEWFDIELVARLAITYPDALILLIGADTAGAQKSLAQYNNIQFTGEIPYKELTQYLYAFDVCLLPFRVIPLILATNPVKVYEYLGAGKSVVAVDVPEIKQFGNLVRIGKDQNDFVIQVGEALKEPQTELLINARKKFAAEQTWHHRARAVEQAVKGLKPAKKVSVILVTYNNLELTKACLHSLDAFTQYENLEIIIVDNASADETPAFLTEWVKQGEGRKIVLSPDNTGFAAGNNMGLKVATGDYLVLLNNDTYVTPGWVSGLLKHLERDASIGLIGPVTNNIGNESRINIAYSNMEEMHVASREYTLRHLGHLTPLRTAAFFCVMMSRATYEKIGLLDEAFGIGFFEDDDYCRRIEQIGLKVMCADDVFIHHHLSASFNKLKVEIRQKLFETNKVTYEKKWGEWVPHQYRPGVH